MRDACCLDRLFAGQLAAAIDVDGASRIGFDIYTVFRAIEYIIRAVMNQRCAQLFGFFSHDAWRFTIDAQCEFGLAFRLVDCCVGGRVNDQRGFDTADHVAHLVQVGQVHLVAVNANDFSQTLQATLEFVADLAGFSCNENAAHGVVLLRLMDQAKTSALVSRVPILSLPDSNGSPSSGQSMPMAGSFHKRLRSNSGAQ